MAARAALSHTLDPAAFMSVDLDLLAFARAPGDLLLLLEGQPPRVAGVSADEHRPFGYTLGELKGRALGELVGDPGASAGGEVAVRTLQGGTVPAELRLSAADAGGRRVALLRPRRPAPDAELRELNDFLDAVVENIPDMVFVKDAQTLLFKRFNRAGEELLGWSRAELLGRTDHDFYPKEEADFFHQKDRETLAQGALVDVPEEPIHTRSRGLRWLHTRKVPVLGRDGRPRYLLGISEDITERKVAEERLRSVEQELAAVVRHARDAIVSWGPDGRVASWNGAAEALYGLPEARALGMPAELLVPEPARAAFREETARLLAGESLPLQVVTRLRGEAEVELEESRFVIRDGEGRGVRVASIARDVTDLARLRQAAEILGRRPAPAHGAEPSPKMRQLLETAERVARDGAATVLILGETGVGKSWLARRLHQQSPRARSPLFEVNCASLDPQLVESELFGHERGAFTGAASLKRGIVEVAEGGTLFLDEVGELPPAVQAKLLTFLESRTFRRLGGTRIQTADVRLLAATNADLRARAEQGQFRRDLYYRLAAVPLEVPPLRERRGEIRALAEAVLEELGQRSGRAAALGPGVAEALERYGWPGNVRELRNALERALILSGDGAGVVSVDHLPAEMRGPPAEPAQGIGTDRLEDAERQHIERVLESVQGNRTQAAEILGISRSTLKRKLARR